MENFKRVIREYLDKEVIKDPDFAKHYNNESKNLDDCIKYVISKVTEMKKDSNCVALTDDEVYGMAIHYYTEKDIDIKDVNTSVKVISPYEAELTDEDKKLIKEKAIEKAIEEEKNKIKSKSKPVQKENVNTPQQQTLF